MPNGNQWCGPLAGVFFFKATPMTYAEKLRDPRWQKKRLQILERDNWTCQDCGSTEKTLHIHHLKYRGKEPWDVEMTDLITLCNECHEIETMRLDAFRHDINKMIWKDGLSADQLYRAACFLIELQGENAAIHE